MRFVLCCAVHELGHAAAVWLMGGRIGKMELTALGGNMTVEYRRASYLAEFAVAAAGGAAGMLFSVICAAMGAYVTAGMSLAVTAFNFLPVCPLDGGRMLNIIFSAMFPERGERLTSVADKVFSAALFTFSLYLYIFTGAALGIALMAAFMLCRTIIKKPTENL